MPATPAWLAAVEAVLNRGLQTSVPAADLARRLEKTALRIDVEGILAISASVIQGRLSLVAADRSPASADATISGSVRALLELAASERGAASRKARDAPAQVRGDAEVANLYRKLFAAARPDAEEELSRFVGDLAARRLSQFARNAAAWARHAHRTASENIAEYLQEESRDLVNKTELEEFLQSVDALREGVDRVEARITRLERQMKSCV